MSKSRFFAIMMCFIVIFSCIFVVAAAAETTGSTVEAGIANDDTDVNIADLVRIKRYLTDQKVQINFAGADCNNNGYVDNGDISALRNILLGEEDSFNKLNDLPDVNL